MPKPRDCFRVFVVGGSVGLPYAAARRGHAPKANPALDSLKRLLSQTLAGARRIEVIGCAMAGYDSPRERLVVQEIAHYQPDLVILMTGNNENDRRAPHGPNPLLRRLFGVLGRSRLLLEIRESLAPWLFASLTRRPSSLSRGRILKRFENNVRAMARACRDAKVPLLVCALPANLRDWPPQQTMPRRWLDDPVFMSGWIMAQTGRTRAAVGKLAAASRSSRQDPVPRFYLARSLEDDRDVARAKREYERALDESFPSWAATPAINSRLRRIAREEGLVLADLQEALADVSANGIPGYDVFLDHCHWRPGFYPLINATIAEAWARFKGGGASLERAWRSQLKAARRLAATPMRDPLRLVPEPLYRSPQQGPCNVDERLVNALETAGSLDAKSFQKILTPEGYDAFLKARTPRFAISPRPLAVPPRACFLLNAAEAQRRAGHPRKAEALFMEALRRRRASLAARLGLAVSLAQTARHDQALRLFNQLARQHPDHGEIVSWRDFFFGGDEGEK